MKLATRLSLAFALAATLPLLAVAPLVLREVRGAFEAELDHRLEAAVRSVQAEGDALAMGLLRSLDEVATGDALHHATLEAAGDPARLAPLAGEWMAGAGVDILALLDREGRVLSSGHLRARVGDPDPAALRLSRTAPREVRTAFVEVRARDAIANAPALVAARPASGGQVHVFAGRSLTEELLARFSRVAAGSDLELLDGERVLRSLPAPEPPLPGAALLDLLPAPAPRSRTIALAPGSGLQLRVRTGARSLAVAQARIVGVLALLLLVSVALATLLGALLARRIVRPVEALAAGAGVVARGDLGHRVEVRAGGEVGELVEAFNRMSADLLRERERAALAERIAAWQEVARRLAHEIKNPLSPIAMSVETLRDAHRARSPLLDEIFEESTGAVLEEVQRLKKIVDEFSRFARLPPPALETVAPAELAAPLVALYAGQQEGIRFRAAIDEGLPPVRADRDQILQVLHNLVRNAEQAVAGRGTVTLRIAAGDGGIAFAVEDDGPGVPPEDRERIFEPWFTTKEAGTGLGLAIARRIAEEHGGSLAAEDAPAGGARFVLRLPASTRDA